MEQPILTVDGLGKSYQLGLKEAKYPTFREALVGAARAPLRRLRHLGGRAAGEEERFWALKDVSFEVKRGEVVGIIGRNGAGKSTLLKILSRITEPTTGRAILRGRVASLLEVGTGFHPELSGRENIYLNGSILGMKKREIDRKFDEIVAFAEVEKFLDTPVKHYSSGMYVRLAFAVAAHLEPEILIVDEVLAVGDAEFQKKCMGKMQEVAEGQGRTVLFVSHNMAAVRNLCTSAVRFESGQAVDRGEVDTVIYRYSESCSDGQVCRAEVCFDRSLDRPLMTRAKVCSKGETSPVLEMGDPLEIEVEYRSPSPMNSPRLGFVIHDAGGVALMCANNRFQSDALKIAAHRDKGSITCKLGAVPLMPGSYSISLWFGNDRMDTHHVADALSFTVLAKDLWGNGQLPPEVSPLWWPCQFQHGPFNPTRGS